MILYHGTRASFNRFSSAFFKTGEGADCEECWYFCSTLKGALYHCESILRCDIQGGEGLILECDIPDEHLIADVDSWQTDFKYGRPVYGVDLVNSDRILITRVHTARTVFKELYRK